MRNPLLPWTVLLLAFGTSAANAQQREPQIRNVVLPNGPDQIARPLYVAGEISTVLRFEQEVDPSRTEMVGWKGRFEPQLIGGKRVVIEPVYDLTSADHFPLVVTFMDGTQVPFTVQAAGDQARVDHQVNLFWDYDSEKYLRASLDNALSRERMYREQASQYEKEEGSPDHALAALLATGSGKQTLFLPKQTYIFKEEGVEIVATVFSGKGKAAVLAKIKNRSSGSWSLKEARVTLEDDAGKPSPNMRPCAVRVMPRSIAPGESGTVALVVDKSAFASGKKLEALALQIIRADGRVQVFLKLEPALARR